MVAERAAADPFAAGWPLAAACLHDAAGRPAAALAELRVAGMLAPDQPEVLAALGRALALADRGAEAEPVLRAAIAARPGDLDLRNRLATVLWKANRLSAMLALLEAAIADFGPHPTLLLNQALALNVIGEQEAALAAADAAIPAGGIAALVNRIAVLPYHPSAGTATALRAAGEAIGAAMGPTAPRIPGRPGMGRALRVGLLSGGLGQHPVGWLTLAGLEALPEAGFELVAYSLKPRTDPLAARFRARCALWREVGELEDAAIAARIAEDRIDILIELGGYGEGGRPFVLQRRPAPVQVKWVGAQFSTLGLGCIDWMLTDRWETPPGHERFYTERLLRLPDGYVCYLPPPYAPPVGPLPALAGAGGGVTFGCFNNLAKVTPSGARRLGGDPRPALPDARLVLRTHAPGGRRRPRDRTAPADRSRRPRRPTGWCCWRAGHAGHRGLIAAPLWRDRYRARPVSLYRRPHGLRGAVDGRAGGRPGRRQLLRPATRSAIPSNVGLADWVAQDTAGYVALAVARARDLAGAGRGCGKGCGRGSRPRRWSMRRASGRGWRRRCARPGTWPPLPKSARQAAWVAVTFSLAWAKHGRYCGRNRRRPLAVPVF